MNQVERISYYEKILNEGEDLLKKDNLTKDDLLGFYNKYKELSDYFESQERKEDIEADEAGLLPSDLLRGVLGEDYAWDFLTSYEEALNEIK